MELAPLADGRIRVEHREVRTALARIRERRPFLFADVAFLELSPSGVSLLAIPSHLARIARLGRAMRYEMSRAERSSPTR